MNSVANISSSNFTENGAAAAGGAAYPFNYHHDKRSRERRDRERGKIEGEERLRGERA